MTDNTMIDLAKKCGARHSNLINGGFGVTLSPAQLFSFADAIIEKDRAQRQAEPERGHLIRLAAWLLSPEPTRPFGALEENSNIGYRQFSKAQTETHEVLRLKAIEIKGIADKLYTAAPPPAQVPEGWKLVPISPTEAMLNATMADNYVHGDLSAARTVLKDEYRAMLAAAPNPS
jgi:hypothetical protein